MDGIDYTLRIDMKMSEASALCQLIAGLVAPDEFVPGEPALRAMEKITEAYQRGRRSQCLDKKMGIKGVVLNYEEAEGILAAIHGLNDQRVEWLRAQLSNWPLPESIEAN